MMSYGHLELPPKKPQDRPVYGTEALLYVEIGVPNPRTQSYEENENLKSRLLDLELIEEARKEASLKMAAYQNRVARLYNRKVNERTFQVGDLVLRYAQATQIRDHGKLSEIGKVLTV